MDNQVSDNFIYIGGAYSGYNAATTIAFSTGATNNTETGTERMRIGSDGTKYFGNPTQSRFQMNPSGENFYQYTNTYYIWGLYNDSNNLAIESLFSGAINFKTASQTTSSVPTTGTTRMSILPSGSNYTDIVIGTTTTSYGGNAGRGTLTVGGSNTALYSLQIGGVNRAYLYCDSTATYLDNASGTGDIVVVNGTGGVKLTRNATSWVSNSDERLKNINSTIENAVEKLLTLRTINFSWKTDDTNKENIGLIAQDVEKVFPQLIHKSKLVSKIDEEQIDETEYLGVRYTELIPVLVKAIQELKAEIEQLKQK